MFGPIKSSLLLTLWISILTGVLYPLAITAAGHAFFPWQSEGSILQENGKAVGSVLIGQPFDDPRYFWSRLSATSPVPYNASGSSGSNLGPTNPALLTEIKGRLDALHAADPSNVEVVPVDLVTSSASGLDPDITPAAAYYQLKRVARVRGISEGSVEALVERNTQGRFLGILGEARVNVLQLNLALDKIHT